jgi:hypothetical protein
MSVNITNSAGGVSFYTNAGVALATGSLPKAKTGAMLCPSTSNTGMIAQATLGKSLRNGRSVVKQTSQNVIAANLSAGIGSGTIVVANSGGYCSYRASGHGLSAGIVVSIADTSGACAGVQMITAAGTDNFTTTKSSTFYANAGTVTYYQPNTSYTFASMKKGQYIMMRGGANTEYLSGVSGFTKLRSGGSPQMPMNDKSIKAFKPSYEVLAAKGLRAGYWNVTTGKWTTLVQKSSTVMVYTCANAQAVQTTDKEGNSSQTYPGILVYKSAALNPSKSVYYPGRSNW